MQLGLTSRQIRVYLTLVQLGLSTVSAISDDSKIKREDLYRVIEGLFEAGLVKKEINKPMLFSAVPFRTGISMLLEQKNKESLELFKKANDLISHLNPVNSVHQSEKEKARGREFVLIPKKSFLHTRGHEIRNLRESMDGVCSWKTFLRVSLFYLEDARTALDRGVRTRTVVEKPDKRNSTPKSVQNLLMTYPRIQVKFTDSHPPVEFVIDDNRKTIVFTSPGADFPESDILVSTNISILRLTKGYFDTMWNDSNSIDVRVAHANNFSQTRS